MGSSKQQLLWAVGRQLHTISWSDPAAAAMFAIGLTQLANNNYASAVLHAESETKSVHAVALLRRLEAPRHRLSWCSGTHTQHGKYSKYFQVISKYSCTVRILVQVRK